MLVDWSVWCCSLCSCVFWKHRHCAPEDQTCTCGIKEFDSMAIESYLNQSCCTPQPHVPGSSLAFSLALEDELTRQWAIFRDPFSYHGAAPMSWKSCWLGFPPQRWLACCPWTRHGIFLFFSFSVCKYRAQDSQTLVWVVSKYTKG